MSASSVDEITQPGTIDLWCYFPTTNPELIAAQTALLSPDELERCGRFRAEGDRRLFVATRALVRTVLSSYFPVAPADWRFSVGPRGKPAVALPEVTPRIHFNLAQTAGLVVCGVSAVHESIGVDAEMRNAPREILSVAESQFSKSEKEALRGCPVSKQQRLFFAFWTLKESYLKSRGDGFALPLDRFSFHLEDSIRIAFDPSLADDAASWRFALLEAAPDHLIAVAVKTGIAPLTLRARSTVPLGRAANDAELVVLSGPDLLR